MVQVLTRFSNDPLSTLTHIHNKFLHFLFLVNMKSMPVINNDPNKHLLSHNIVTNLNTMDIHNSKFSIIVGPIEGFGNL